MSNNLQQSEMVQLSAKNLTFNLMEEHYEKSVDSYMQIITIPDVRF
ncbi:MAG TPA: hypothetical protein PKJ08_12310 [Candidatus Cloacimonadota bacterium]|nr:hypothetical protein [Candidatus Cloacimonadota bacterium]HPM02146.1 hypothetical protein [Candidatus Cloacimonadota bacterium]